MNGRTYLPGQRVEVLVGRISHTLIFDGGAKDWARRILADQKGRPTAAVEMACAALGIDPKGEPKP